MANLAPDRKFEGEAVLNDNESGVNFVDPILLALPDYTRERYLEITTAELRRAFVEGYRATVRWKNDDSGQVIDPELFETDLDHVLHIYRWTSLIEQEYPQLWSEVFRGDQEKALDFFMMMGVHDIHGIKLGDVTRASSNHKNKKRKHRESLVGGLMIDRHLEPQVAARVKYLYREFEKKSSEEPMYALGHLLDKGQASQNMAKHVVPFTIPVNEPLALRAARKSMRVTTEFADRLAAGLSVEARRELRDFLHTEIIQNFDLMGHPGVTAVCAEIRGKFPLVLGDF